MFVLVSFLYQNKYKMGVPYLITDRESYLLTYLLYYNRQRILIKLLIFISTFPEFGQVPCISLELCLILFCLEDQLKPDIVMGERNTRLVIKL